MYNNMSIRTSTITKEIHNLYKRYNSTSTMQLKKNLRKVMAAYNLEPEHIYTALGLKRNTFYGTLNYANTQKPTLELLIRISVEFEIDLMEFL
jgi:hypothetical protein